jgi:hypothetical protein
MYHILFGELMENIPVWQRLAWEDNIKNEFR